MAQTQAQHNTENQLFTLLNASPGAAIASTHQIRRGNLAAWGVLGITLAFPGASIAILFPKLGMFDASRELCSYRMNLYL